MQARIEGPFHEEGALGNGPGLKNATEPAFVNSVLDSRQVAEDHFRTLPPLSIEGKDMDEGQEIRQSLSSSSM